MVVAVSHSASLRASCAKAMQDQLLAAVGMPNPTLRIVALDKTQAWHPFFIARYASRGFTETNHPLNPTPVVC